MRWLLTLAAGGLGMIAEAIAAPASETVAILYNTAVPESKQLAEFYSKARGIPEDHLVGLKMPAQATVTRQQYEQAIAQPLREAFDQRGWWRRAMDQNGLVVPVENRIRVLVTMRGVPLRVKTSTPPPAKGQAPPDVRTQPFVGRDEAAVDSELAMVGVEGLEFIGSADQRYFNADEPIADAGLPFLLLTARIDAPTYATCERMITDAIETERLGLWGMTYVDIANKYKAGDDWLSAVVRQNLEAGMPTVVDRFNPTLPTHYPMREAAMYFGWYSRDVDGPFLNPGFRFLKGAVAMHLHSYSAEQLVDPAKNWSGALLERGACVTLGNVYEPYLNLTHDFGLLHKRLLAGYSWVEACWMAIRVVSWQGVVLGDPLYQPFRHLDGSGVVAEADRDYRALRAAMVQWRNDPEQRHAQLKEAAVRMKSGVILEALGLELIEQGHSERAATLFLQAREFYQEPANRLRLDLHLVALKRAQGRKPDAVADLRVAEARYAEIPEVLAVKAWLNILDPPPPPPAKPGEKGAPAKPGPKGK